MPAMTADTPRPQVAIMGAGPAGCLLAILLSKQNLTCALYDFRPDPRLSSTTTSQKRNRSINLALSTRGLTALSLANLDAAVTALAVPMHGRCIHPPNAPAAPLQFHRYGQPGQHLLSASRSRLNELLLDACEAAPGVQLTFGARCLSVDLDAVKATMARSDGTQFVIEADLIVGADGARSAVRASMARRPWFNYSQSYVSAAYKELTLTNVRVDVQKGVKEQAFPHEWLHIWPRHRFMLIALPNDKENFTATLFMDKEMINSLQTPQQIEAFFNENFPDAIAVMPTLVDDYITNPTPSLVTVRCAPHNYKGNAVLIGDAAHAVVPFYGQGCNAAFESCRLLAESIRKHGFNRLETALESYSTARMANADAIADLALDHYEDMSSRSAKPFEVFRRRFEIFANRLFPRSFLPLYSMISFSNIPYAEAVERAEKQDRRIERFFGFLGVAAVTTGAAVAAHAVYQRNGCNLPKLQW